MELKNKVLAILCESRLKDVLNAAVSKYLKLASRKAVETYNVDNKLIPKLKNVLGPVVYNAIVKVATHYVKPRILENAPQRSVSLGLFTFVNMIKHLEWLPMSGFKSVIYALEKGKKPEDSILQKIEHAIVSFLNEKVDDFLYMLIAYLNARELLSNTSIASLKSFAKLDPMKMTFETLSTHFHSVSRFFDDDGNYVTGVDVQLSPRKNQELVAKQGRFYMYKLTKKEQCNDPYFSQGATYCITTKNYFGNVGKPPYYVIMRKNSDGFDETYAALVPSLVGSDDENAFRNATNTRMLFPEEARPIAALIRKAIPASLIIKKWGPKSAGTRFTGHGMFLNFLGVVYGKKLLKRLRFNVGGAPKEVLHLRARMRTLYNALLRKYNLRKNYTLPGEIQTVPHEGLQRVSVLKITNSKEFARLQKLARTLVRIARKNRLETGATAVTELKYARAKLVEDFFITMDYMFTIDYTFPVFGVRIKVT